MKSIVFKSTMPAVITRFTTAALLLVALAACNSGGGGGGGGSSTKKAKPTQVFTNLKAAGFNRGVDLSWDAVKDATSYTVYYHTTNFDKTNDRDVRSIDKTADTNISITGLTNKTTYHLRVGTIIKDVSHLSGIISTKTNLRAPINLKATGINQGVDLSWDMVRGATKYTVYYHTASFDKTSDPSVTATTATTATNTSITGLANGTTYYLRVEAINAAEDKKLSTEIVTATAAFQAPNLKATGVNKEIKLTWAKVSGAIGYTIYYHTVEFDKTSDVSGIMTKTAVAGATDFKLSPIDNGTKYYFRMVAKYPSNEYSALSNLAEATAMLPATTIVKATGGDEAIDLTWDIVTGTTSYTVYYHTASFDSTTDGGVKSKTATAATNTSIAGLSAGTEYFLRVEAKNDGTGKWNTSLSAEVTATTNLATPTIVAATAGDNTVDISWSAVTGATSYTVYYRKDNSFDGASDSTADGVIQSKTGISADNTSIIITGLSAGTKYYLRVEAINANNNGDTSLSTQVIATTNLATPTGVTATARDNTVDISWGAVTGATSYTVYYRKDNSFDSASDSTADGVIQSKTGITTTNTSITGLSAGTKYYLRVEAINANNNGDTSLSAQVTAFTNLATPTGVKATGKDKAIDISWDAVTGATSYKVYYHDASFDDTTLSRVDSTTDISTDGNTASTRITGLSAGTKYYLRVEAINANNGDTSLSDQVEATTKQPAPQPSAAGSIISPAAVDLSWVALDKDKVTDYEIYYAKNKLPVKNDDVNINLQGIIGGGETTTDASATSITIGDLSIDTIYHFVVVVNYKNKEKAAAPEVTADSSYIDELAMGGSSGCVRLDTGGIKCWGKNDKGQLGVDDTTDRYTATSVSGIRAKQLSVGDEHSCAIDLNDKLYCWGGNGAHQLGLSDAHLTTDTRNSPKLVKQAGLASVSLVTAGRTSTCALADVSAGGTNYCWGNQYSGGLGDGAKIGFSWTVKKIKDITPDVKQFALGSWSGCAIDASGDLWCWGYNSQGQVGDGITKTTNKYRTSPVKPLLKKGDSGNKATMVAGGSEHYCAVDKETKVQCWGYNNRGQLGIGSTATKSNRPQYVLVSDSDHLKDVSKVATGSYHSCALMKDRSVRCWGDPDKLGFFVGGSGKTAKDKVQDIDNAAIDIAAGARFTCVLLADKKSVKCWGDNSNGQLGISTDYDSSTTAVAVTGL